MRRLGCLTPLGLIAVLITLTIVGGAALTSKAAMFSPGALSAHTEDGQTLGGVKSHAELVGNCTACHVDPWSSAVMASRCLSCHADVRAQLDDPNSLHGALPDVKVCRTCHAEHNGANCPLTRVALNNFPHDRLKFTLAAHQKMSNGQPFTCADCHGDNVAEFDRAKCETCHREYQADFVTKHVADFGNDCLACHDGADRFSRFDHNRLPFALSGEHSQIACGQCHTQVRGRWQTSRARRPIASTATGKTTPTTAPSAPIARKCHTSDGWKDAKFDHNSGGVQTRRQAPDGRVRAVPRQQRLQGHTADLCGLPSEGRSASGRVWDGLRAVPQSVGLEGRQVRSQSGGVQTGGQASDGRVRAVPRQQRVQRHAARLRGLPSEG